MFHLYGLLIGLGVVAGIAVATLQAKHFKVNSKLIDESLLWIVIPAIVGARLYHVITDWQLYAYGPLIDTLKVWNGGLGYFGALIGGLLGLIAFAYTKGKKNPTEKFFLLVDLLSLGAPLAQAIGRFGNYFNRELYGVTTDLPWGILVNGQRYHPLFAYEAIANLCVFIFINWLGLKKKLHIGKGQYACIYLACYGLIRFWLEFLRIDTARWSGALGIFSIAQWVAIGITLASIIVFWLRRHSDRGIQWELKTFL
ncbi:MAG: prolipoprotein diacylglyceryl transferase [Candidatus Woesebacteria bacterium]